MRSNSAMGWVEGGSRWCGDAGQGLAMYWAASEWRGLGWMVAWLGVDGGVVQGDVT